MLRNTPLLCLLLAPLLFCGFALFAQDWQHRPDVVVRSKTGKLLTLSGSSGLNSPQISTLDLNADGLEDLVVFDRTSSKVSVFRCQGASWIYDPRYESVFPPVQDWFLLVDFDGDGQKDLFTAGRLGFRVFKNIPEGRKPKFVLFRDPVRTKGISGASISLQIDVTDIPIIKDFDADGDLDVLSFTASIGQFIEYNQNFSVERFGRADSLIFEKVETKWGNVKECLCDAFVFDGSDCRLSRLQHAGSSMICFDDGGDGDLDLLVGDVDCPRPTFLENFGSNLKPLFTRLDNTFPNDSPIFLPNFPAFFLEDMDFDGEKDLLAAPNVYFNDANKINFEQPLQLFKNMGSNRNPLFIKSDTSFLSAQMPDLGEDSHPAAADLDSDGDMDLLVGYRGKTRPDGLYASGIAFFENTGTDTEPVLEWQSDDYLNLQSIRTLGIKPFFGDINSDGLLDLAFTDSSTSAIKFMPNRAATGQPFRYTLSDLTRVPLEGQRDLYHAAAIDIDRDTDQDLIISSRRGSLSVLENQGDLRFVTKQNNFLGVNEDFTKREPVLWLTDLNKDNKPDLLLINFQGRAELYSDCLSETARAESVQVLDAWRNKQNYFFGQKAAICAMGDFLVVGGRAGGLQFVSRRSPVTALEDPKERLRTYISPNPAQHHVDIFTEAQDGFYTLYSPYGQVFLRGNLLPNIQNRIQIQHLPQGIYFIQLVSAQQNQSFKLVKE